MAIVSTTPRAARPSLFRAWCLGILESDTAPTPQRVLATIAARHCANSQILEALRKQTTSDEPERPPRRMARAHLRPPDRTLTECRGHRQRPRGLRPRRPARPRDARPNYTWYPPILRLHHRHATTTRPTTARKPALDDNLRAILERLADAGSLAAHPLRGLVRADRQGRPDRLRCLRFPAAEALARKPTPSIASPSGWRKTPHAPPPPCGRCSPSSIPPGSARKTQAAQLPHQPGADQGHRHLRLARRKRRHNRRQRHPAVLTEEAAPPRRPRTSLEVVYFYKPGCQECAKTKQLLASLKTDFPLIKLREHNILETSGTVLNQALCAPPRRAVRRRHSIAPAVFTQAGFVIGPDISPASARQAVRRNHGHRPGRRVEPARRARTTPPPPRRWTAATKRITLPVVLGRRPAGWHQSLRLRHHHLLPLLPPDRPPHAARNADGRRRVHHRRFPRLPRRRPAAPSRCSPPSTTASPASSAG